MMPFLIWLDKTEIDDLISRLSTEQYRDSRLETNNKEDLMEFANHLLHKNNALIQLLKGIEPLDPKASLKMIQHKNYKFN